MRSAPIFCRSAALRAIDRSGNVDPTPAVYEFTLAADVTSCC
jgi:hypothetical protein